MLIYLFLGCICYFNLLFLWFAVIGVACCCLLAGFLLCYWFALLVAMICVVSLVMWVLVLLEFLVLLGGCA